jgi:Mce-associated membrane protein
MGGFGYDVEELDISDEDVLEESTEQRRAAGEPEDARGSGRGAFELGLLVLAAVALVIGVVTWQRAGDHDQAAVERAALRDAVLITARSHIETMNTLDHDDVDGGLEKWQDVTTGTLKDQIAATDDETRKLMADQQMVSSGKVVDAAVLDLTASTATVIASVEVTVVDDADPSAPASVKRNRFAADLVKVGDRWLLEGLDQVAVEIK